MADKRQLTDRFLKSLEPAEPGKRYYVLDTIVGGGFGAAIYPGADSDPSRRGKAGKIAFFMFTRFSRGAAPARRIIGFYPATSLEQARSIAGEWRSSISKGIDPSLAEQANREREAREAALHIQHSFAAVAERFIEDKLSQERDARDSERVLRASFITPWAARSISEITPLDVLEVVNAKKKTAPQMARSLLVLIRRFYGWAIDQHIYNLDRSPCDRLNVSRIIGPVQKRNRRLNDGELFAFMRAVERMPYPTGPLYKLLLLSGLRLAEAAELSWQEIQGDTIVIPSSRMKGREGTAVEHQVPVTTAIAEILASLPRFKGGKFLFSASAGKRPARLTGPTKAALDWRMLRTLRALARRRGEDHEQVTLPHWVNHDLRRTVRSGLSALRVPHDVAEAVLAHRQGGISGTYNLHEFEVEKREALEAWARHVASIVSPQPTAPKVVQLQERRR